uniref:PH domain-containing protein n=1 Tax=Cacopsylla melanoneura TaxID=428564 RepID=A0A8D8WNS1_9HEMI
MKPEEINTEGMAKPVKGGYLLRHKRRMFGKSWREEWVVLYDDSTLAWYKEKGRGVPEGCIVVKDAPELLAVSQWTMRIPGRPDLPSGSQLVQLMAFGTRTRDKVHWLLAQSEQEVHDWMTAITNTLPPPPLPPDEKAPNLAKDAQLPPVQSEGENKPEAARTGSYPNHHHGNQNPTPQESSNSNQTEPNQQSLSNAMGNYGDALMMGATLTNWGHSYANWGNGYGWGVGWGWNEYYSGCHEVNYDMCTGADLSCDDADYGMDWGGDICF